MLGPFDDSPGMAGEVEKEVHAGLEEGIRARLSPDHHAKPALVLTILLT